MKTKIYVACFTGDSGLTDYSVSLCRELAKVSDVTLITATSVNPLFRDYGFKVKTIFRRTRHYAVDVLRFAGAVLKQKPDWVLFQSDLKLPLLETLLVYLFRAAGVRVLITVHDVLPHYPKPWSKQINRLFYGSADKLVAHSERSRWDIEAMGVRKQTLVVPHGVYDIFNTANFTREDVGKFFPSIEKEDFVLLFFGHVDERKGIREFILAANILELVPGMKFIIAGRNGIDPANRELNSLLASCKARNNFIVHDRRIPFLDVQKYFAMANVVVLPYLEGTTSGVLKLALAFGKPVVATDVGDIGETVREGMGVLAVNEKNLEQDVAKGISLLRANYAEYAERCKRVGEPYQWCNIGKEYYQFLVTSTAEHSH